MNWFDVNDSMMLNLDELRAIAKEDDYSTRVFISESSSVVVPMQYESLRAVIGQRITLDNAAKAATQKSLNSIMKGQRTLTP